MLFETKRAKLLQLLSQKAKKTIGVTFVVGYKRPWQGNAFLILTASHKCIDKSNSFV